MNPLDEYAAVFDGGMTIVEFDVDRVLWQIRLADRHEAGIRPVRYVLRIGRMAGYYDTPGTGLYVGGYDHEYADATGWILPTPEVRKASTWGSVKAARATWEQQSKTRPFRRDGMPNRPLTVFDVSVEWVAFLPSGIVTGKAEQ